MNNFASVTCVEATGGVFTTQVVHLGVPTGNGGNSTMGGWMMFSMFDGFVFVVCV
jgi:hypothetical protein